MSSYRICNLPNKNSDQLIVGHVENGDELVVRDGNGWEIFRANSATLQGQANNLATAIRLARDIGFEQGREYVRDALGIKDR